ncbi:uncharacterized protein BXZ73DRAFT_103202 [Epithele typhae]|uniref:uncharacterized protein n=1 Tax=Epithele typhae TaxID=378194 RepID=UPI002007F521|nr:uncharacterized protein BXZ73DRAFT_103202 [Epithele typhae]KAH9925669.1 hypothetical protein BXZ73DRAFT_103202 [Epithele typhae]
MAITYHEPAPSDDGLQSDGASVVIAVVPDVSHAPSTFRPLASLPGVPNPPSPNQRTSPAEMRDADLWFEDGTLVLVVENTAFRVFKGLLTLHSPVFKAMLETHSSEA